MKHLIINTLISSLLLAGGTAQADEDAAVGATAAQEWHAIVDPLGPIGERLATRLTHPNDPQLRQELYRALVSQIATGYLALLYADPKHPDFWPYFTDAFAYLGPNPDNDYYVTPIDEDGIYRITGYRGTVHRVDFQLGTGAFVTRGTVDDQKLGVTLGNYDLDGMKIGKDGSFEAILSAERPAGYKGNWMKLYPKARYLLLRQISYDWVHEVDGRFAIERVDQPAVKPRMTTEELASNLKQISGWAESLVRVSANFADGVRKRGWVNKVGYIDLTEYGGIVTQKYLYGIFDLLPDEALVIESDVPKQCRYWSIHLTDDLFFTLDYMNRQTSLNGYTAKIDKDHKFRVVISAQDPGVANWLDTAGYQVGAIQGRWEKCSSWPEHKVTKMKIAEVRHFLPADTPAISAAARDASIRERRRGAQMRKRW